jgi:hypothetical protein
MTNAIRISSVSGHSIMQEVASARAHATALLKRMLLGGGLTLAAATSSLAQSYDPSLDSGNIVPFYGQTAPLRDRQSAGNDYAHFVPRGVRSARKLDPRGGLGASTSLWNVYNYQGIISGSDPDPNIRFQLNRESLQGRW